MTENNDQNDWPVQNQTELLVKMINNYKKLVNLLGRDPNMQSLQTQLAVNEAKYVGLQQCRVIDKKGVPLLNMIQNCVNTLERIGEIQSEADDEDISSDDSLDNLNLSVRLARDTLQELGIEPRPEAARPRVKEV